MNHQEKLKFARNFAITHHKNMYGDKPYSFHLDAVYDIVVEFELGPEYEIAAYLHDILEDTPLTKEELEQHFGFHITEMVYCVSGFGTNRKEKQKNIKDKMLVYPESIDLKMADRLANMRNSKIEKPKLYSLYCKEHSDLAEVFSKGNSYLFNELEKEAGMIIAAKYKKY